TLLPVVLPVRIVEIPEVAIRDRHRIIRDRRVPDAHPLRIDASIPPPILIQNVLLAHANGGADEIAHLLGPTLGPEVFLDLNPLLSRLRILDKASQQCLVDTTLFIAEVCRDDGVWIRPEHHVVHLVIRHANAEAVHLMLEQLVFYELLKDELALLIEELWRHRLPGTLL